MKAVFINVDVRPDSQRRLLPVGLGYVVTAVSNAGIPFDIIDMVIDHMSMEELELRLTRCEYDVYALGCIVTGYKYVRKIAAIIRRVNPSVGFLLPLPMTPIYEWARKNGHIGDEVAYLERIGDRQDFHINLTSMSDSELVDTVESELRRLAEKQGLKLDSVMKTVTYRKPEKMREMPAL
jgi:hypothetical protein